MARSKAAVAKAPVRQASSGLSDVLSDVEITTTITTPDTLAEATATTNVSAPTAAKKRKAEVVAKTSKRTKTVTTYKEPSNSNDEEEPNPKPTPKRRGKKVTKENEDTVKAEAEEKDGEFEVKTKVVRKRKTKEEKERDAQPLAARTSASECNLLVGAHVSAAGGVQKSIDNVIHIGANSFALFLKSQRKWNNPAITDDNITLFKAACQHHSIDPSATAVPHGSYLVNLAHPDEDRQTQAYDAFLDDLTRCHKLSINLYNFHPGNSAQTTREDGIANIAMHLNKAHKDPSTGSVITLLETMASVGNTVGGTFEDINDIIQLTDDKSRVGVCLDTCHVFAAGYDLRTPEAFEETMSKFDEVIGLKYLKALHVNDSKAPYYSHRDLHARIGEGFLGLRSFHNMVNEKRLWGLPMVLETPIEIIDAEGKKSEDQGVWAREIKLLESLVGMDVESEEFKALEKELQDKGQYERERVMEQVNRKKAKDEKAKNGTPKKKGKGKKMKAESEDEDEGDERMSDQ